jgi:cytochrome oxidase Cu insertion factor (SCO1/SenC/PrrC family)
MMPAIQGAPTFVSSRCTTICPLTSELLSRTQDLLGPKERRCSWWAVNANYLHRSVGDVLKWSKLHSMTHRWVFLTGSLHGLTSVYAHYGITAASAHTIVVYLIDRDGRVRTAVPVSMKKGLDAEARVVAKDVRSLGSGSA